METWESPIRLRITREDSRGRLPDGQGPRPGKPGLELGEGPEGTIPLVANLVLDFCPDGCG